MTNQEWEDCNELSDLRSENKALKEQLKAALDENTRLSEKLAVKSEQLENLRTIFYEVTGSVPSKAHSPENKPLTCGKCTNFSPYGTADGRGKCPYYDTRFDVGKNHFCGFAVPKTCKPKAGENDES